MAVNRIHHVLCPVCFKPATTRDVYDNGICGVEGRERFCGPKLKCTEPEGTKACAEGFHIDKYMSARFEVVPQLRARHEGETRRA